jgi:hypothetical protein
MSIFATSFAMQMIAYVERNKCTQTRRLTLFPSWLAGLISTSIR